MVTALNLRTILLSGGNVIVNSMSFSALELRSLALAAKTGGGTLLIKNATDKNSLECRSIALAGGKGVVTFDFTN